MTDEEWHTTMLAKLDGWLRSDPDTRKPLFQHMHMSPQTFMQWRETGHVDKAARLLWVIFDDEVMDKCWGRSNA